MKIVKNKHAPPFRTAQFELEFGKGISRESELIELGCKHKFITKSGSAYYSMNGQSFHGKDAIKHYLAENASAREELMMKLREKLMDTEPGKTREAEMDSLDVEHAEEVISPDTTDDDVITAVEA